MKDRELFLDRITIDEGFSMQVEPNEKKTLIFYENDVEIDQFSLTKRIYTLFKVIQDYTENTDFVYDKEKKVKLYGKAIHIKDNIFMKLNDEYESVALDFYRQEENKTKLLYITRLNYMSQKLFYMMLIPERVMKEPNYQILNPLEFKDLMDILSVIKI